MNKLRKAGIIFLVLAFILTAIPVRTTNVYADASSGFVTLVPSKLCYFNGPSAAAVDSKGNLYVSDNNNKIYVYTQDGNLIRSFGEKGAGDGQFNEIGRLAIDSNDNIYVTDQYNHRVQKFSSEGKFLKAWGSEGTGNGQFKYPYGIAIDKDNNE